MTPSKVASALVPFASLAIVAACTTSTSTPKALEQTGSSASAVDAPFAYRGILKPPPAGRTVKPALVGPPATSYPPTGGCASALQYYGGAIIANPVVVQVSWNDPGTTGTVPASVEGYLQTWWPAIISPQAGYLEWLSEYNTVGKNGQDGQAGSNQTFGGSGTYAGLFKITPAVANQGATVDDTQIKAELVAQLTAGKLPAPTYDTAGHCNTIYMIDFPPSVTDISMTFAGSVGHSCSSFCGYHMGTTYKGKDIYYGVHPDFTSACTACAPDGLQQDLGMVHSHELGEAMTDAQIYLEALNASSTDFLRPGGWDQIATGCSEIGDSCAWPTTGIPTVTYSGQSYYVQGLFDNAHMDCETSGPAPQCTSNAQCSGGTPICDTTSHVCRACTATDCTGLTPVCATSGGNAGQCVQCGSNANCSGATPFCDATTNTCRACGPSDCTGSKPVCETSGTNSGTCVECDATSHSLCVSPKAFCDTTTDTCRGCASNTDCSTSTNHVCDTGTGVCVACVANTDCTSNACDTTSHTCVQCLDNSECNNPKPVCNTTGTGTLDTCRACASDGECAANTHGHACASGGSCVQCTATNHTACTGSTPVCDVAINTCVGCMGLSDCPVGDTCDATTHTCKSSSDGGSSSSSGGSSGGSSGSGSGSGGSSGGSGSGSGGSSGGGSGGSSGSGSGGTGHGDAGADGGDPGTGGSGGCAVSAQGRSASDLAGMGGLVLGLVVLGRRRGKRAA